MIKWKAGFDYPTFMTEDGLEMLKGGYLVGDETPAEAIHRIASASANILHRMKTTDGLPFPISQEDLIEKFESLMWKGHLSPSSPIWANMGTRRGLPVSCFGSYVSDNMQSIANSFKEVSLMTVAGGGTSIYWDVRSRGSEITQKGKSDGVMQFIEIQEAIIRRLKQGEVRKGALASYIDILSGDFDEFMTIRSKSSDVQTQTFGVCVSDEFIEKMKNGDREYRRRWALVLKMRSERGMPYIFFTDNVNNNKPEWFKKLGLKIRASNLCTEIALPSNDEWSFVCCLASMNLKNFREFAEEESVFYSILLLEAVMEDFIRKSEKYQGLEKARAFAIANRSLGLGAMGWHTFLQEQNTPFTGLLADVFTKEIFGHMRSESIRASEFLARVFGEPKVCDGYGRRHSTLLAPAPNVSTSIIQGVSAGIECNPANAYKFKGAKGKFTVKNKYLEKLLEKKGKNTKEVWDKILNDGGSVLSLDFLTDEEKEVFLTFAEQNQMEIVKQAAIRQRFIDQSQSLNLNFPPDTPAKDVNAVVLKAHELGIKTLYYQRSSSILRGLNVTVDAGCVACDG